MRGWRSWLVLGMVIVPATAGADGHKTDLYVGPGYADGSNLFGFEAAWGVPFPKHETMGVVSDFSMQFGGDDEKRSTLLTGFRVSFRKEHSWKPFGQLMLGVVQTTTAGSSRTAWVGGLGGGLEYFKTPYEDKTSHKGKKEFRIGFRVQAELTHGLGKDSELYFRSSAGVVVRFLQH